MPRTRFPAPATNLSDDRNRSAGPESFRGCRSLRTDDAKRSSLQNRAGHWAMTKLQFRSWSRMNSNLRFDNPLLSDDLVQSRDGQFHFFRFGPSDSPAQALN